MVNEIYIHLGLDKTGTTTIQGYLNQSIQSLAEAHNIGVPPRRLHPLIGSYYAEDPTKYTHNIVEMGPLLNISLISERDKKAMQDLDGWMHKHASCEKIIFSHEGYLSMQPKGLRRMIEYFQTWCTTVKAIVYFRPKTSYALSAISQKLASGQLVDEDTFVERLCNHYNLRTIVSKLDNVFGIENTIVRVFDRRLLVGGDVLKDFMQQICTDHHIDEGRRDKGENQSLSHNAAVCATMLINKLKESGIDLPQSIFYRNYYKHLRSIEGEPLRLKQESIVKLSESSAKDYEAVQSRISLPNDFESVIKYTSSNAITFTPARIKYLNSLASRIYASAVLDATGEIRCSEASITAFCGSTVDLKVTIANNSDFTWSSDLYPISVSYHIEAIDTPFKLREGLRTRMTTPQLTPGESHIQSAKILAPDRPGEYLLKLTLVQDPIFWFDSRASFRTARLSLLAQSANHNRASH